MVHNAVAAVADKAGKIGGLGCPSPTANCGNLTCIEAPIDAAISFELAPGGERISQPIFSYNGEVALPRDEPLASY